MSSIPQKPTAEIGLWIKFSVAAPMDTPLNTLTPPGKLIKFVRNNSGGDLLWLDDNGIKWFQPGIGAGEMFPLVAVVQLLTTGTGYGETGSTPTTNVTTWRILGE